MNKVKHTITMFCSGWETKNTKIMLDFCQKTWREKPETEDKIEALFGNIDLIKIDISNVKQISNTFYCVTINANIKRNSKIVDVILKGNVICEKAPYQPHVDGEWGVNPLSLVRNLYEVCDNK